MIPRAFLLYFDGPAPALAAIREAVRSRHPGALFGEHADNPGRTTAEIGGVAIAVDDTGGQGAGGSAGARFQHRYGVDEGLSPGRPSIVLSLLDGDEDGRKELRALAGVALAAGACGDLSAVGWTGASTLMGGEFFTIAAGRWLDGGAFPVPGLIALFVGPAGNICSFGLETFAGHEIAVAGDMGMDRSQQAKLAIRVIDHVVRAGPLEPGSRLDVVDFGDVEIIKDEKTNIFTLKNKEIVKPS